MNDDPTSLDRLHDLVVAPPAPWWPPAPGWLWLLGIAAAAAVVALVAAIVRRQRNRYRRDALAELERLESAAAEPARQREALLGMADVLKRAALTAYPRRQVAPLTGADWFAFLDRSGGTRFGDGLGAALETSLYEARPARLDADVVAALTAEIRAWIRGHRVPADGAGELGDDASPAAARTPAHARASAATKPRRAA